ncbi:DNA mismatch repair endonuclease MutL [Pueribacillus sp. YX66]|uniref:DNA mismatch repair endonuclease MutL n=1 Tax=Pueribacillus sp. YX66 TaxID=3229242 RepID=UPI00358D4BDD
MPNIIILDEQLANQIAAGEVVERPASIVKELVENAIDANSTMVKIVVEDGGLQSIQVTDNGDGISEEDCELAFERHATSKIKHERDLFSIRSLGFRGEALPSIASVSRTEVKTCTGEGPGTHIIMEAGELKHRSLTSSRKGTEISVSRLFFNTPARLKYLKTVHTELGNITDVVNRLAMAHPNISFQLIHNGKQILHTDGKNNLLQVIASIYGVSVAKNMVEIQNQSLDFSISGFTTKPEETRASRKYMSLFINGRFIRNYTLANAIVEGYHTFLPLGRFPISVIHVQMDPTLVDINVHPAKLEARLSKERELVELMTSTIRAALQKTNLIPEVKLRNNEKARTEQVSLPFQFQMKKHEKAEIQNLLQDELFQRNDENKTSIETENKQQFIKEPLVDEQRTDLEQTEGVGIPPLYPVGQVHGTYIIAQNEDGLYLIDQHAAQERIKYEYFFEKMGETPRDLQDLLVPLSFEFSIKEAQVVEENLSFFQKFGIYFEQFGDKTYIVRSHPSWFPNGKEEETIRSIVELLLEEKTFDMKKIREDTAIMMACKKSIKANHYLRQDEMVSLLQSLRRCREPYTCPHGRPVIIHFSTYELEKMFKRVM